MISRSFPGCSSSTAPLYQPDQWKHVMSFSVNNRPVVTCVKKRLVSNRQATCCSLCISSLSFAISSSYHLVPSHILYHLIYHIWHISYHLISHIWHISYHLISHIWHISYHLISQSDLLKPPYLLSQFCHLVVLRSNLIPAFEVIGEWVWDCAIDCGQGNKSWDSLQTNKFLKVYELGHMRWFWTVQYVLIDSLSKRVREVIWELSKREWVKIVKEIESEVIWKLSKREIFQKEKIVKKRKWSKNENSQQEKSPKEKIVKKRGRERDNLEICLNLSISSCCSAELSSWKSKPDHLSAFSTCQLSQLTW